MSRSTIDTNLSRKVFRVADYFIAKNNTTNKGLSNKKLQKLLYYSQAWHLVLFDGKALFNEPIQAWIHGPAIPRVYGHFKEFVMGDIVRGVDVVSLSSHLTETERKFLDEIWKLYSGFDASYLEALTHREEPWQKARKNVQPYEASTAEISHVDMKEYYGARLKEAESTSKAD
jgi:uncharacterized phage-associated protein